MGIQEIPESLEGLISWSKVSCYMMDIFFTISKDYLFQEHEGRCMIPDPANAEIAASIFDEQLSALPDTFGLKTFGRRVLERHRIMALTHSSVLCDPDKHLNGPVKLVKHDYHCWDTCIFKLPRFLQSFVLIPS